MLRFVQQPVSTRQATIAHVVPFAAWLLVLLVLGEAAGWKYAVRVAVGLGLLLWLKPWTNYPRWEPKHLILAGVVGLTAFLVWVVPDSALLSRWPRLQDFYVRYAVLPWGQLREVPVVSPYAPDVVGWTLTLVRLLGSALVISVIEEFFWRGFVYRWYQRRDFLAVDPGRFDVPAWLIVAVVFGFEHAEWLAGTVTGLAYGWLYIRTRDIWACCVAHATTNLLLGVYVLATGSWAFWS